MIIYAIGKRLNDTGHHINTADIMMVNKDTLMLPSCVRVCVCVCTWVGACAF